MQDTSIKGDGTSRFIKGSSNFPSTWEEFRNQIVAGTLTADIGLNPAGCTVVGTALSKANLLTDKVANQIGLGETKTINEALNKLFTFADDGKRACASAVSAMGVQTSSSASFDTIANNIRKIKTGSDVSGVTALSGDVRSSKRFVGSDGVLRNGSLVTRGAGNVTHSTSGNKVSVTVPAGIYDSQVVHSASVSTQHIHKYQVTASNFYTGGWSGMVYFDINQNIVGEIIAVSTSPSSVDGGILLGYSKIRDDSNDGGWADTDGTANFKLYRVDRANAGLQMYVDSENTFITHVNKYGGTLTLNIITVD